MPGKFGRDFGIYVANHVGACLTIASLAGALISGSVVALIGHERRHTRTEVLLEHLAERQGRALDLLEQFIEQEGRK